MKDELLTVSQIAELFDNKYSTQWLRQAFYRAEFAPYRSSSFPMLITWNYKTKKLLIDVIYRSRKVPNVKNLI